MIYSKMIVTVIFNDTTSHFNDCPYLISFEFEDDERVIEIHSNLLSLIFGLNCLFKALVIKRASSYNISTSYIYLNMTFKVAS